MPADTDAIALLEKLEDFFGGPDLTTAISDFAAAHGAEFHLLPEGAEHPLQWHSRYLEYCGMIEQAARGLPAAARLHVRAALRRVPRG